jgi:hypothetical protein
MGTILLVIKEITLIKHNFITNSGVFACHKGNNSYKNIILESIQEVLPAVREITLIET